MLREKKPYAPRPTDLPDEASWFRPALLPGTLIGFHHRVKFVPELRDSELDHRRELHAMAPYDLWVAVATVERMPVEDRTVENLVSVYGPLSEYSLYAMGEIADAAWYDPPEYRRRQGALCELVPEKCFLLGFRLAELGFREEAAEAYQSAFDRARDRVWAANEAGWLVRYYLETDQAARAESVARRAAATHSGAGLLTLALVMEERDRLDDAEALYRQVFETYDDGVPVAGFYYRRARVEGREEYEGRLREALALALPTGQLEPLDRDALPPEPVDGVVVRKENDNTKRYGIKWGHVIVGVDGYRVRDFQAYDLARALSYSPRMTLVVWRGASYDEIEVELWDRRFRITLEDFSAAER
jgi:tetratricopeptide (TPR) repeat protein